MKKQFFGIVVIAFLLQSSALFGQSRIPSDAPFACTSFAVFGGDTLYGMNFDYPDVELLFRIRSTEKHEILLMDAKLGDNFLHVVGMNSDGFFANLQMLFPEEELQESVQDNELFVWQIFDESLVRFSSAQEVEAYIESKKIVHGGMTLHSLFADQSGDAFILEPGKDENEITRIKNRFIVMTNFPVCQFREKEYKEVEGSGAGRYIIAYEHIMENFDTFDLKTAMKTLEKAKLTTEEFSTQCSMVFDPEKKAMYFALGRDYGKIWKASITERTIERYSGFEEAKKIVLDESGVLASELLD